MWSREPLGDPGAVIHHAAEFRVTRIRFRRTVEHPVERSVTAPRDLPKTLAVKVRPSPMSVAPTRLRRPMAAADSLWNNRRNLGELTDEGVNLLWMHHLKTPIVFVFINLSIDVSIPLFDIHVEDVCT